MLADDSIFDRKRRAGPDLSPLSGLSFNDGYEDGHYAHDPELVAAAALKDETLKAPVTSLSEQDRSMKVRQAAIEALKAIS